MTPAQHKALLLIGMMDARQGVYDAANAALKKVNQDFPATVEMIDGNVYRRLVEMLDEVLGDTIASYYLDEVRTMKDGGSITENDGRVWPIRNVDDVAAYVGRSK